MADEFYTDLRDDVADSLLKEFGKAMTLRAEGSGAVFDGASGFITTPGSDVDHTITGVVIDIRQSEVNGTNVLQGDKRILMSPVHPTTGVVLDVEPDTSMIVVDGTTQYAVTDVNPISPGGVAVIYKLQVRE